MKKTLLILTFIIITQNLFSQVSKCTGVVLDKNNKYLAGCEVRNTKSNQVVHTNSIGQFSIDYSGKEELITFTLPNYIFRELTITEIENGKSKIILLFNESSNLVEKNQGTISPSNYWIGAKVGYNFVSNSEEDNFIGAASVSINMLKKDEKSKNYFSVIGNIGDFKFTKDTAEVAKVQKLAQSVNGISVGLAYEYKRKGLFWCNDDKFNNLESRFFLTSQARFTTYKNIGVENETINFPQNVNTLGFEFELGEFEKGGKLSLTLSTSAMFFDKNDYELIFEEEKNYLQTYETTLIIPLLDKIGFFVNGTFSQKSSALFSFGVVIK